MPLFIYGRCCHTTAGECIWPTCLGCLLMRIAPLQSTMSPLLSFNTLCVLLAVPSFLSNIFCQMCSGLHWCSSRTTR